MIPHQISPHAITIIEGCRTLCRSCKAYASKSVPTTRSNELLEGSKGQYRKPRQEMQTARRVAAFTATGVPGRPQFNLVRSVPRLAIDRCRVARMLRAP